MPISFPRGPRPVPDAAPAPAPDATALDPMTIPDTYPGATRAKEASRLLARFKGMRVRNNIWTSGTRYFIPDSVDADGDIRGTTFYVLVGDLPTTNDWWPPAGTWTLYDGPLSPHDQGA